MFFTPWIRASTASSLEVTSLSSTTPEALRRLYETVIWGSTRDELSLTGSKGTRAIPMIDRATARMMMVNDGKRLFIARSKGRRIQNPGGFPRGITAGK